jgi:DNA-binding NarL/FixJ family response regulator
MDSTPSILVADDLPMVAEGIAALCEDLTGFTVSAVCNDGDQAWCALTELRPAVAFLDQNLSGLSTLDLLRRSRESALETKLVVLAARADRKSVLEALRSGAHAYVLKTGSARQLEDACRHVLQGGVYLSPRIELQSLVEPGRVPAAGDPLDTLSEREQQVFAMLVEGVRAKEIANRLQLSPKTVDTYRASLMRKLDIHDVAGLVKFAIRRNLTALEAGARAATGY